MPPLELPDGLGAAAVHSHTLASDGMVDIGALVAAAAAAGISVLCVTDHDTLAVDGAAVEAGLRAGVEVVRGEEVTTALPSQTHVIGLYLNRPVRMGMSLEDTVDAIHDQGGLAVLAHPLVPSWFASITLGRARRLLEKRAVDGIELRHTAPVLPGSWDRLDAFYAENRDRLGAAVGSDDSHFGRHDIGRLVTAFPGRTAADLRRAIAERTTSPLYGVSPPGPPLALRLAQQRRSLLWLPAQRLRGRVGKGDADDAPAPAAMGGGYGGAR